MNDKQQEKLLTVAELASKFSVSRTAIRQMVLNDSIPHIKIDNKPYFNEAQIKAWQEALIKERYTNRIREKRLVGEQEKLEYYQHFICSYCEYESSVEVYSDDTVYGIVEKIKRNHTDGSFGCKNELQDIVSKGQYPPLEIV